MNFLYKAKNNAGEIIEGNEDAENKIELYKVLQKKDLSLISAVEKKSGNGLNKEIGLFSRVSMHEKIVFARNLAVMLNAGLALSRALAIMERQTKNNYLKKILGKIEEEIRKGTTFHESLALYPRVFSQLFISMVAAGEESGKLSESLQVVGSQMEKSYILKKKVRGALIYPAVIISAMIGIGIFMLMFVVPTLTSTFTELNIELPATTKFIIFISNMLQHHYIVMVLFVLCIGIGIYFASKTAKGKQMFNLFSLHVPVIGNLVKEINAARTARTLSSLLSSGVTVLESLRITGDVLQNVYFKRVIHLAEKQIQVGAPISKVFTDAEKIFPVYVGEMMAVGEETGELGTMLHKVAEFFEEEVDQKTKDMSTIIEPFLMLIVGAAVGFFALSMITPMYSLVNVI